MSRRAVIISRSVSRIALDAVVIFLFIAADSVAQSFSMYMPYAETTILSVASDAQLSLTSSAHWACTALYNASPVRLDIFVVAARSLVAHTALISPAMSSVPSVDIDLVRVFDKTSLIPARLFDASDVSLIVVAMVSPAVAFSMALTSAAVLGITSMFKSLKSCNWVAVWLKMRSSDFMESSFEEHTHRRYVSFWVAQN